jgi:hypothetical protein
MNNPETMSLFEREMRDQVAAAREALTQAERKADPLLVQASLAHLEGLVDLARRNGINLGRPAAATQAQSSTQGLSPAPGLSPAQGLSPAPGLSPAQAPSPAPAQPASSEASPEPEPLSG